MTTTTDTAQHQAEKRPREQERIAQIKQGAERLQQTRAWGIAKVPFTKPRQDQPAEAAYTVAYLSPARHAGRFLSKQRRLVAAVLLLITAPFWVELFEQGASWDSAQKTSFIQLVLLTAIVIVITFRGIGWAYRQFSAKADSGKDFEIKQHFRTAADHHQTDSAITEGNH